KRVDVLLEAARMLKGRGHAFQLLIAGTGPQDEKLRQLAASLGLDDEVRFLGYLEPPRARIALSAADLVVSTSLFENRSLAMLEAFACGTPVMGTPGGGTPELLRMLDPRLIFAGMDAEDVAAGLGAALGPDFGL